VRTELRAFRLELAGLRRVALRETSLLLLEVGATGFPEKTDTPTLWALLLLRHCWDTL
jgi:hypothetical protein